MTRKCESCNWTYDDEFRSTICPHNLFPANDGQNNFSVHFNSELYCPHDFLGGWGCFDCNISGERS